MAGSIHSEVIELLGCHNVASGTGHRGIARVSLEQLLMWQPNYIITQDPEFVPWVTAAPPWHYRCMAGGGSTVTRCANAWQYRHLGPNRSRH
ncbi:hypothetical protein [Aliidiomarina quisquiliarum]|uniref:hypothetical protein n=1 Tax=Aliidiomarina quisquiliarum TaxID=2938947 RepID=UPI00208E3441|nr:hypothetical protein [Aliidiomarina quisquiliarum]MCO4320742.1 hypothetical protein [Aliidiomarina quisquiliarum]